MNRRVLASLVAALCVFGAAPAARAIDITGSGTADNIARFTSTFSIGNSVLTQYASPTGNGTYIGINTLTPFGSLGIKCHQGYEIFGSDSLQHFNVTSGGPMHLQPGFTVTGTVANPLAYLGLCAGGLVDLVTLERKKFTLTSGVGMGLGAVPDTDFVSGYRLKVNGKIRAKEIKVESNWSDFVFEPGYRLTPLDELERSIARQGHLPGMPSAQDVAIEGVDVGDMQARLLQKVEELTLYVIQLNKENQALRERLAREPRR